MKEDLHLRHRRRDSAGEREQEDVMLHIRRYGEIKIFHKMDVCLFSEANIGPAITTVRIECLMI